MYFPIETKCKISADRTLAKKSEKIHRISPTQMKKIWLIAGLIGEIQKSTVHPTVHISLLKAQECAFTF